jgi:DNA-binding response OmpR family regulator
LAPETWLLVAEDDDDLRNELAEALRSQGYTVHTAADGAAVGRMLDLANPLPAVVILDLLMPYVSGVDVLKAMRSVSRTRDVPVVVLTGTDADDWSLAELGVTDILLKPVSVDRLTAVVRRMLSEVK